MTQKQFIKQLMSRGVSHSDACGLAAYMKELRQLIEKHKDKPKDLSFYNLERVKATIICEAMALVLSGEYEPNESKVKSNPETDTMSPEEMARYLMGFCRCWLATGNGCPGCTFDKPTSNDGDGECRLGVPSDWDF
jgi:hypothetical protein|nr:MAG TPA: hypothetical protein [Caudoviricetes sp.]